MERRSEPLTLANEKVFSGCKAHSITHIQVSCMPRRVPLPVKRLALGHELVNGGSRRQRPLILLRQAVAARGGRPTAGREHRRGLLALLLLGGILLLPQLCACIGKIHSWDCRASSRLSTGNPRAPHAPAPRSTHLSVRPIRCRRKAWTAARLRGWECMLRF